MPTVDHLEVRTQIQHEFQTTSFPAIESDVSLVWVLSGPQLDFLEKGPNNVNQTMRRLKTGMDVSLKVASLKVGRNSEDLHLTELEAHCPPVLFNGWMEQNRQLHFLCAQRYFESQWRFPDNRIVSALDHDTVKNTKDQLAEVPRKYIPEKGKVVIVSDAYHLPRVKRYLKRSDTPVVSDRVVLAPAQPFFLPADLCLREMIKIPHYIEKGDLPL